MTDTKHADDNLDRKPRQGDLTQGPILRTLLSFSLPTFFTNMLQALSGTINAIWVGQLLGESAVAATANANIVTFLVISFIIGLGTAATVKIGQYYGARDIDAVRQVFGTSTAFCMAVALLIAILGWMFADPLLRLLATPPEVHDQALAYLRVVFLTMPFTMTMMNVAMALRGIGDSKTPLYASLMTTALGIGLNPAFILGLGPLPAMGVAGAALANAVSALVGMAGIVAWIYWRDIPVRLRGRELSYLLPIRGHLAYVVAKGVPMGLQMTVSSAAALIMIGMVNREGMLTTAAFGACLQLGSYLQMPSHALSIGVSAMVAQSIGAGRVDRIDTITRNGVVANLAITSTFTVLMLLFDRPLLALFLGSGSEAIPIAEHIQVLSLWSYVIHGWVMVITGALRAYGAVILPLIAMIVAMYPARLGFYWLAYPRIGAEAIWWTYPVGAFVALGLTWLGYRYGAWRQQLRAMSGGSLAPAE